MALRVIAGSVRLVDLLADGNKIVFGDELKDDLVKQLKKSNAAALKAVERAAEIWYPSKKRNL